MDWFEKITGFQETTYDDTRHRLTIQDGKLIGRGGKAWSVGQVETPTLAELRQRAAPRLVGRGRTRVSCMTADVRELHAHDDSKGALFQVASQFNLLEMVGPDVTPEHGVTRYQSDATQGPACAIAAGAGTIYRNYLVPVGRQQGQRAHRQIDCLVDLARALGGSDQKLWQMRNGYALCTRRGLSWVDNRLRCLDDAGIDELRGWLRIGLHWDVDVTDLAEPGHRVSQAYCSALPVAYSGIPAQNWALFAGLVLEAAYEATMLAALINRERSGMERIYLTSLGGGAFGNDAAWIAAAMRRAIKLVETTGLDVRLVSYRTVLPELREIAEEFA